MSKTWYPVIMHGKCIKCGACTEKCRHGVYDINEAPTPIVVSPENCIHGCKGCGDLCPIGAIVYMGDSKAMECESCNCCNTGDYKGC